MNRIYIKIIVIILSLSLITGIVVGGLGIYRYIKDKEKENADYTSTPMRFDYANSNPESFWVSKSDKVIINLEGLNTDKEKILHILQVADINYMNSMYIGKYKKGETNMTASVNKPIENVDLSKDLLLKSKVVSELFEIFNNDISYNNLDGKYCASSYEQNVFYMENFVNEGKGNRTLEMLLPMATDALNKGNYYIIYDKVYWKLMKYPRYIEETDSFELTENSLEVTEFEYLNNGDINHYLDPMVSIFPFALSEHIIANNNLSIVYDEDSCVYKITFEINADLIDLQTAEDYFYNMLTFEGGKLNSYSAEIEIWDCGLIKSITENQSWSVVYDTGLNLYLYMDMPLVGTTYFSYNKLDADIEAKLYEIGLK